MPKVANLSVDVDARTSRFDAKLAKTQNKMRSAGRKMSRDADGFSKSVSRSFGRAAKSITSFTAASLGLAGVGATFVVAAKKAAAFGTAMAEVSTLLNDKKSLDSMKDSVLALSAAFGSDAVTQAKALYQVISAGADTAAEAMDILTVSNKLAKGGVTDVETAADGLTSTLNAFGAAAGSATDVSDAFFVAVKAGKTTVGELSTSIGNVAPLAAQAGVSLDELLASTAALTKGGVKTSVAMNGIRAILIAVVKPQKAATDLAKKLGIEFSAAALKAKGFSQFIKDMATATGGDVEQMGLLLGSSEAIVPALALAGAQAEDFTNTLEQMKTKTGETEKAFVTISATAEEALNRLAAESENAMIAIGGAVLNFAHPAILDLIEAIKLTRMEFGKFANSQEELSFLVLQIKNLEDALKDVQTDKLPDWMQFAEIDRFTQRLEALRKKYNEVVDRMQTQQPALPVGAGGTGTPVVPPVVGGGVVPAGADQDKIKKTIAALEAETEALDVQAAALQNNNISLQEAALMRETLVAQQKLGIEAGTEEGNQIEALIFQRGALRDIIADETKERARVKQIVAANKTELEKLNEKLAEYNQLKKDGLLGADEHAKAIERTKTKINDLDEANKKLSETMDTVKEATTDAFADFVTGATSAKDAVKQLGLQMLRSLAKTAGGNLFDLAGPAISSALGGFFADGGRPPIGKLSVVGEKGPELFMPDSAGTIVPNDQISGGGGMTIFADMRGASVEAVQRLEILVGELNGSIEPRAVDAVVSEKQRNPALFGAS